MEAPPAVRIAPGPSLPAFTPTERSNSADESSSSNLRRTAFASASLKRRASKASWAFPDPPTTPFLSKKLREKNRLNDTVMKRSVTSMEGQPVTGVLGPNDGFLYD